MFERQPTINFKTTFFAINTTTTQNIELWMKAQSKFFKLTVVLREKITVTNMKATLIYLIKFRSNKWHLQLELHWK